jgi:hypothetical protein
VTIDMASSAVMSGKARAALAPGMALVVAFALLVVAVPARAKEHAAGCALVPTLIQRLRNTLVLASVQRGRGSSLAAYQVLRTNADGLLRDAGKRDCGALSDALGRALARADAAPTAADAALELDLGYTAALALVVAGRLPSDGIAMKQIDVPESVQYGDGCPDLFALVRRLEKPDGSLPQRAESVLADLRAHPRCARVRELLEGTSAAVLPATVDALVLDEAQNSPSADNPIARCPEFPAILDRLTTAISRGAPLFNRGDHEGCRRLYEQTARTLTTDGLPAGRCPVVRSELGIALADATHALTAEDAAWALRRGFDRIAGWVRASEP